MLSPEEKSIEDLLKRYNFFDPEWYVAHNVDVQLQGVDPWAHFVRYGINENRQPNSLFDPLWYLDFYEDVRKAGINPLLHYLRYGISEGRRPHQNADPYYNIKNINLLAVEHCTNACRYCSTSSQFAKKISHPASSFFPWLDLLESKRIPFTYISVTGGEPFLHPEIQLFIDELAGRYPSKRIGITTNFFWANENNIRKYAQTIRLLNGGLYISLYENLIKKFGNLAEITSLVQLLKDLCPEITIEVWERAGFTAWELHLDESEVMDTCITSDCYILRADGKISHCSIGVGLENRQENLPIINLTNERLFDLTKGVDGFLSWAMKYPFDLCLHCTMWRKVSSPWSLDRERV